MFLGKSRSGHLIAALLFCCAVYLTFTSKPLVFIRSSLFSFTDPFSCSFGGNSSDVVLATVKNTTRCKDNVARYQFQRNGDYFVLYNYVISSTRFKCEESVTYVTHADYTFLNNLEPLLDRWRGPVSIALHAPGTDLKPTLESIAYLRTCTPLVKQFVTFHIYFSSLHLPDEIPSQHNASQATYNCSLGAPYENVKRRKMYVAKWKLLYPINVGRNIARSTSETHFVLNSDIELYPSPNLISRFLEMVAGCEQVILRYKPAVFALHVFEIERGLEIPNNKRQLRELLDKGVAIPFHRDICSPCHNVPKLIEWKKVNETETMYIFNVGKRTGQFYHWEPFYIGTRNEEPKFDERLSWEGMSDKIIQSYTMCLLDYSFLILDNAFLVHSPGIKKLNGAYNRGRQRTIKESNQLIKNVILPEIHNVYGARTGCEL